MTKGTTGGSTVLEGGDSLTKGTGGSTVLEGGDGVMHVKGDGVTRVPKVAAWLRSCARALLQVAAPFAMGASLATSNHVLTCVSIVLMLALIVDLVRRARILKDEIVLDAACHRLSLATLRFYTESSKVDDEIEAAKEEFRRVSRATE